MQRTDSPEQQLARLEDEIRRLKNELLQARDNAIGAAAELGVIRARYSKARAEVDSLIHQLNLIQSSRTWRIGRFFLSPLRGIRLVLRKLMS